MTALNIMVFHRNHIGTDDSRHKPLTEFDIFDVRRDMTTLDTMTTSNIFIIHDDCNFIYLKNRVKYEDKTTVYPLAVLAHHLQENMIKLNTNCSVK